MNKQIEDLTIPNSIEVNVQWGSIVDSIAENIDIRNKEFLFNANEANSINLCHKIVDDFLENIQNSKSVISTEILTKNQKKYSNQYCKLIYNINQVVEDDKQSDPVGKNREEGI